MCTAVCQESESETIVTISIAGGGERDHQWNTKLPMGKVKPLYKITNSILSDTEEANWTTQLCPLAMKPSQLDSQ